MGTETDLPEFLQHLKCFDGVKLNNPLMGTETISLLFHNRHNRRTLN